MGWVLYGADFDLESLNQLTFRQLLEKDPDNQMLKEDILVLADKIDSLVLDCVHHVDQESMGRELYVFRPPFGSDDWSRYDNSIDYYEAKGCAIGEIEYIHQQIFPYVGKFVVESTLHSLSDKDRLVCSTNLSLEKIEPWYQKHLVKLGLDLSSPLDTQIYVIAPEVVKSMLALGNKDVDYRSLKPAIITYWS